jgi:ABC-2 type transport system permease protein
MQAYLTLTRRELGSFFGSITGYLIIAAAVFLMGLTFVDMIELLQKGEPTATPFIELYYSTTFFWLIVLLVTPVITMRLFALEKYSGTFETLMTTPVSDLQVLLAKFTAAMFFYMVMWLPSIGSIFVLRYYLKDVGVFDPGLLGSAFLGIFLIGCLFISLGCLASSITRNQVVAAMLGFTLGFTLFLLSYLSGQLPAIKGWMAEVFSYVALFNQMGDFARGMVDTRHIVFFVTLTFWFLFMTLRVLEARRWK